MYRDTKALQSHSEPTIFALKVKFNKKIHSEWGEIEMNIWKNRPVLEISQKTQDSVHKFQKNKNKPNPPEINFSKIF